MKNNKPKIYFLVGNVLKVVTSSTLLQLILISLIAETITLAQSRY